jgi:hypothetical protein
MDDIQLNIADGPLPAGWVVKPKKSGFVTRQERLAAKRQKKAAAARPNSKPKPSSDSGDGSGGGNDGGESRPPRSDRSAKRFKTAGNAGATGVGSSRTNTYRPMMPSKIVMPKIRGKFCQDTTRVKAC